MKTLVDAAFLRERIKQPGLVVLDARFRLADPAAGRAMWAAGHVPGARHADLDRDLSSRPGPTSGRHPLPAPDTLAARFAAWGIGPDTSVVVYDDAGGSIAARAWWLFRWMGHEDVAVLDGGLDAWEAAGGTLETGEAAAGASGGFAGTPRRDRVADAREVAEGTARRTLLLIDVRESARFAGLEEPIDPVAGHVPGAISLPWRDNLGPDGRFLSAAALARRYREAIGDSPAEEVVFMCGSGVTACHGLLAMAHAGVGEGRLYAGSWSEWIRDPSRPVAGAG